MPKIESWDKLPENVRRHLIDRMRDRAISVTDLNQLRVWIDSQPDVPEGDWYKDFGSFKICGCGRIPRLFYFEIRPPTERPSDQWMSSGKLFVVFNVALGFIPASVKDGAGVKASYAEEMARHEWALLRNVYRAVVEAAKAAASRRTPNT